MAALLQLTAVWFARSPSRRTVCKQVARQHCCPPSCAALHLQAKEEEAGLRDQLAGFQAAEAEQSGDIPALIRERDECK